MTKEELYELEREYFNSLRSKKHQDLIPIDSLHDELLEMALIHGANCSYVSCNDCMYNSLAVDCCAEPIREEAEKLLLQWKEGTLGEELFIKEQFYFNSIRLKQVEPDAIVFKKGKGADCSAIKCENCMFFAKKKGRGMYKYCKSGRNRLEASEVISEWEAKLTDLERKDLANALEVYHCFSLKEIRNENLIFRIRKTLEKLMKCFKS